MLKESLIGCLAIGALIFIIFYIVYRGCATQENFESNLINTALRKIGEKSGLLTEKPKCEKEADEQIRAFNEDYAARSASLENEESGTEDNMPNAKNMTLPPLNFTEANIAKVASQVNKECKFVSSKSCPDGYYATGAMMAIEGDAQLMCNSSPHVNTASAIAEINKEGEVIAVHIINRGYNYEEAPIIEIVEGGGSGAKAKSYINDEGEIVAIEVTDGGQGYKGTPIINISSKNKGKACQLCCKE